MVELDRALISSLLEESSLLQRLIDDLQDLALADAGQLRMHPEPTDIAALARQVIAAHRASADHAGVELTLDADDEVTAAPWRSRASKVPVRFSPSGCRSKSSWLPGRRELYPPWPDRVCSGRRRLQAASAGVVQW